MNKEELTGVASLKAGDGVTYSYSWSWKPPGVVMIDDIRRLIETDNGHIEVNVLIDPKIGKEMQDIIEKNVK